MPKLHRINAGPRRSIGPFIGQIKTHYAPDSGIVTAPERRSSKAGHLMKITSREAGIAIFAAISLFYFAVGLFYASAQDLR